MGISFTSAALLSWRVSESTLEAKTMNSVGKQEVIFKCKYCGQLGVGGLKHHKLKMHADVILKELEEKKKNNNRAKERFMDALDMERSPPSRPAISAVTTSCLPLQLSNPTPSSVFSAMPATANDVEMPNRPAEIRDNDEIDDSKPLPDKRHRRHSSSSSISSNATQLVRYITVKKEDQDSANLDDKSYTSKLFEGEVDEMGYGEKCSKYFEDPYLKQPYYAGSIINDIVKEHYYLILSHQVCCSIPATAPDEKVLSVQPMLKAEPTTAAIEVSKKLKKINSRTIIKCPAKDCNRWMTSRSRKRWKTYEKLLIHFRGHIEDAEETILRKNTNTLAEKIQQKLKADVVV